VSVLEQRLERLLPEGRMERLEAAAARRDPGLASAAQLAEVQRVADAKVDRREMEAALARKGKDDDGWTDNVI
jgi:hypothetical protein